MKACMYCTASYHVASFVQCLPVAHNQWTNKACGQVADGVDGALVETGEASRISLGGSILCCDPPYIHKRIVWHHGIVL